MRRTGSKIWAIACLALLVAGMGLTFGFAWYTGTDEAIEACVAMFVSYVASVLLHELGHLSFACATKMHIVYVKIFCFKIYEKQGKKRLGFASPFAADETQVVPKKGGNMQKRAALYALGGLVYGGVFLALVLAGAILLTCIGHTNFKLWGLVPYAAYLFLLNVMPCDYASGKTDMQIYIGMKRKEPSEQNMLAAMEIQGELYAGKSYTEIDENLYFDLPQLCQDEPLFAVMLDLRYHYYLEKGEFQKAAEKLNRLALSQEYLPADIVMKIAAELVYMHAVNGDLERAEDCGKCCREYLQSDTYIAKRALAAYSLAAGKTEAVLPLKEQALTLLDKEKIQGVAKAERILLDRLSVA